MAEEHKTLKKPVTMADVSKVDHVRVVSDSPISNKVAVMIGDQIIPVTHATLDFTMGEYVKLTLETWSYLVDVVALQENTNLVVKDFVDEHRLNERDVPSGKKT